MSLDVLLRAEPGLSARTTFRRGGAIFRDSTECLRRRAGPEAAAGESGRPGKGAAGGGRRGPAGGEQKGRQQAEEDEGQQQAQEDEGRQQAEDAEGQQQAEEEEPEEQEVPDDGIPIEVRYRDGLRLEATNGLFSARIRWRAQMRATKLTSGDLAGEDDGLEEETGFRIQRARFKIDGHAYRPWLEYYLEFSLARPAMLTFQFDLQPSEKVGVRLGQYKAVYNRERLDSSGAQQFADRSVVTAPFTVDRQQGATVTGRLFAGTLADSTYAGGIFTGTGRGGGLEGDGRPMYVGRWQWNFLKRVLPFSQSDIARRQDPAASLAFGVASNVGQFTRFSSSGGGQLPGFAPGAPDQYKLTQWLAEFAFHGHGLSLQAEYHFKRVDDRVNETVTEFDGWYAQAGYFFHQVMEPFPDPLELAVRVARVDDSNKGVPLPANREVTVAGNWFFNGHNNKVTVDTSFLKSTLPLGSEDSGWRLRGQWDVQF